jgi:hypothetical protein
MKEKSFRSKTEILDDYFRKFPDRNPKPKDDWCSASWRGYRATFEVSDRKIYLKDTVINVCWGSPTSELTKVVPNGERLFVDWFSEIFSTQATVKIQKILILSHLLMHTKSTLSLRSKKETSLKLSTLIIRDTGFSKKKQFEAFKKLISTN